MQNQLSAHTVVHETLPPSTVLQNAAVAAENGATKPAEWYVASIKARLYQMYMTDLAKYENGDPSRFARMVDGKGKQLGTPEQWRDNARNILADEHVQRYFPDLGGETKIEKE